MGGCGGRLAGVVGEVEWPGGGGGGQGAAGEWLGGRGVAVEHLAAHWRGDANGAHRQGHADSGIGRYLANQ